MIYVVGTRRNYELWRQANPSQTVDQRHVSTAPGAARGLCITAEDEVVFVGIVPAHTFDDVAVAQRSRDRGVAITAT